jgi:chromosome segregation ATPase
MSEGGGEVGYLMLEQLKLLRGDVQEVRTEVKDLRGDVQEVRTEVKDLRGDVQDLRGAVDVTNSRLAVVEETLRDLSAQMLILARFVRNVTEKYDKDLELVKARLDRLEGERRTQ